MTHAACPEQVKVGALTYRVIWSKDEVDGAAGRAGLSDSAAWAAYSHHEHGIIGLNPGAGHTQQQHSLLHELVHCVLRLAGCWPDQYALAYVKARGAGIDVDVEEHVAAALAGPLLGVMKDNPDLLRWLLDPEPSSAPADV